ncbi:pirin family protein [Luteimonas sp. A501]
MLSRQDWSPGASRDNGRVANMERLLLVIEGALEVDCGSLGQHRLEAGDLLWMGTGHGLQSRLGNGSATAPLRLVECWLQPGRVNADPAVARRAADHGDAGQGAGAGAGADGCWVTLAADDRGHGSDGHTGAREHEPPLPLRQRARLMAVRVAAGKAVDLPACDGGRCWLEVLDGGVMAADAGGTCTRLASGDGIGWTGGTTCAPSALTATGTGPAWLLLFVLPA